MYVIITMAGKGQRFRDAGYGLPKYQIEVKGRTLFAWALESLRHAMELEARFIFVVRAEDQARRFIARSCRELGIHHSSVVELCHETDGQATTVLEAEPAIHNPQEPILIYNIDTYVEPRFLPLDNIPGDGWIPCFPGEGDHWSFVRLDLDGKAMEVREKQRISSHATIGLYWFRSFLLFKEAYKTYYADQSHLEGGERYIAPLYNQLIAQGLEVRILAIPFSGVHALGTPAEAALF